jgi:hypothetical protein
MQLLATDSKVSDVWSRYSDAAQRNRWELAAPGPQRADHGGGDEHRSAEFRRGSERLTVNIHYDESSARSLIAAHYVGEMKNYD